MPHLLVNLARRLAAGQQTRILIEQLCQRVSSLAAKRRVGVDDIRPGIGEGNRYRSLFDHCKKQPRMLLSQRTGNRLGYGVIEHHIQGHRKLLCRSYDNLSDTVTGTPRCFPNGDNHANRAPLSA